MFIFMELQLWIQFPKKKRKKKLQLSNVNRLCINGFCSNFYRIQNIQIIYWARVTTNILFLPDESSFPLALMISLQSGRKGEKKKNKKTQFIWLLDCLFWFIPVVKMSKTKNLCKVGSCFKCSNDNTCICICFWHCQGAMGNWNNS